MTKVNKAYLIDPDKREITEVPYTGDFTDIYKHIQANMFDAVVFNSAEDVCFVDDEGLFNSENSFFQIADGQPLAGKGLVLGTDEEGDTKDPYITLEGLRTLVNFLGKPRFIIR